MDQGTCVRGTLLTSRLTTHARQDHNRRCLEVLEPYLQEDKRALSWLKREAGRDIGLAKAIPGIGHIEWD